MRKCLLAFTQVAIVVMCLSGSMGGYTFAADCNNKASDPVNEAVEEAQTFTNVDCGDDTELSCPDWYWITPEHSESCPVGSNMDCSCCRNNLPFQEKKWPAECLVAGPPDNRTYTCTADTSGSPLATRPITRSLTTWCTETEFTENPDGTVTATCPNSTCP